MHLDPSVPFDPSPHYNTRDGQSARAVVIHYTASNPTEDGDIAWFKNPESKVSAHFVIGRSGRIVQMVDLEKAAWHAGSSSMVFDGKPATDINRKTIGIELDNAGLLEPTPNGGKFYLAGTKTLYKGTATPKEATLRYKTGLTVKGWWEPFYDPQLSALQRLLTMLAGKGYGDTIRDLVGHNEIGTPFGRKLDPGPLFPWARFTRTRPLECIGA